MRVSCYSPRRAPPGSPFPSTPCGKCDACVEYKAWFWKQRALLEVGQAERTWFVTLTYRGSEEPGYIEIRRWLARVRRGYDGRFRYLCTVERGKEHQRLHWHLLVHGQDSLTKRILQAKWKLGISHLRLLTDRKRVEYVCKYVGKEGGRVRASRGYGVDPVRAIYSNGIYQAVVREFPNATIRKVKVDCNGDAVVCRVPSRMLKQARPKNEGYDGDLCVPPNAGGSRTDGGARTKLI